MEQEGREVHLTPGDLVIYDTSKPYVLSFDSPFVLMVIQIPHDRLRIPTELVASAVATRIGADDGLGRAVSPFLMSIATNMEDLKGPAGAMLAKNPLELLESLISNQLDVVKTAQDPHWDLLRKIQDYVDDNLADPELGPPLWLPPFISLHGTCIPCSHDRARLSLLTSGLGALRSAIST